MLFAWPLLKDLTWMTCTDAKDMICLLRDGSANIVRAETRMNKASSRSHTVLQVSRGDPRGTGLHPTPFPHDMVSHTARDPIARGGAHEQGGGQAARTRCCM